MKKSKWIQGLLLGAVGLVTLGAAACDINDKDSFTGFLPGLGTKVKRTELLVLADVIDYVEEGTYTITLEKKGEDGQTDLTEKKRWPADEPGEYTITYTIHKGANKGTYTYTFIVPADYVTWDASTDPINIFYEMELRFEDVFSDLNLYISSYYEYETFIENIRVGDTMYEITDDQTSFYVQDLQMHYITYGIRTQDGQVRKSIIPANVIYSDDQTTLYLNELSSGTHTIEVEDVQSVEINGETCAAEDVTITADGVTFDKKTLYEKYAGVNFVSLQTPDGEVRDTIYVYTDLVSFEDARAIAPTFLTLHEEWDWRQTVGQMVVTDQFATDGERALRVIANDYYWPMFVLHIEYLDMIFSSDVDELAFDMTYAGTSPEHAYRGLTTLNGLMPTQRLYRNVPTTIHITREIYEKTKAVIAQAEAAPDGDALKKQTPNGLLMMLQNGRNEVGGWDNPPTVYVDNFRTVNVLEKQIFSTADSQGTYSIPMSNVTEILFNGQEIPADKATITQDGVTMDKAWLCSTLGENELTLKVGKKTYRQTICVYHDIYDFEDGNVPNFITWHSSYSNNPTISVVDYNGSKALELASGAKDSLVFEFAASYLDFVFADEKVEGLAFDITYISQKEQLRSQILFGYAQAQPILTQGQTHTYTITRTDYETMKGPKLGPVYNFRFAFTTAGNACTFYIDNIQPTTEEASGGDDDIIVTQTFESIYDFENGKAPSFITWKYAGTDSTISVGDYNSSKALILSDPSGDAQYCGFDFAAEYLHYAFKNPLTESITFDLTYHAEKTALRCHLAQGTLTKQVILTLDETATVTITREDYNAWKSSNLAYFRFTFDHGSYSKVCNFYLDNLKINLAQGSGDEGMGVVLIDFEDGQIPSFIAWNTNYVSVPSILIADYNGSKALELASAATSDIAFEISAAYLDELFADASVTAFAFDITYESTKAQLRSQIGFGTASDQPILDEGVTYPYKITRADYNAFKALGSAYTQYRFAFVAGGNAVTFYIDNMQVYKA